MSSFNNGISYLLAENTDTKSPDQIHNPDFVILRGD